MFGKLQTIEKSTRYDRSKLWDIHREYFLSSGISIWKRGEIPYSGVSNYNEAYKKAQFFVANLLNFPASSEPIRVLEVGSGYGEFACNFLRALRDICEAGEYDFFERLEFYLSDYSDSILAELQDSGRLDEFSDKITFVKYDAWISSFSPDEAIFEFELVLANYLLDQFPARIFACKQGQYYEQYLSLSAKESEIQKYQEGKPSRKWIKKIKKDFEFREFDLLAANDIAEDELDTLRGCFRHLKDSTVTYSYGSLKVLKNFLSLLSTNGIIICSDFNASSRGGLSPYEACYYGNSLAQGVNFEFLNRYFVASKPVILYEDPIRPLHTLILTREDFEYEIELGEVYKTVYKGNWFLRVFYRYMLEMQVALWIFVVIFVSAAFWFLIIQTSK